MLWQRVLTAIPLAVLVIWMLLFQPTEVVIYLLLTVAFLSGLEWARLAGMKNIVLRSVFAAGITFISWFVLEQDYVIAHWYVTASAIWWLAMAVYLARVKPRTVLRQLSYKKLLLCVLIVPAAVMAMTVIHAGERGPEWLLYGLMLVWLADIGAYFAGRRFGKHKLAPALSPGKTREGFYGALLVTTLYSAIASVYFELGMYSTLMLLLLSLLLTLLSVAGDLYESLLKREAGFKDSGKCLPGHGGVLDRIDSVLSTMPILVIGIDALIQPFFGALL